MLDKNQWIVLEVEPSVLRLGVFHCSESQAPKLVDWDEMSLAGEGWVRMAPEGRIAIAFKQLLERMQLEAEEVILALDAPELVVQTVDLPPLSGMSLDKIMAYEAAALSSEPLEDTVWDGAVLGEGNALIAVASQFWLEGIFQAVSASGLSVRYCQPSAVCLGAALRMAYPRGTDSALLVQVGEVSASLVCLEAHKLHIESVHFFSWSQLGEAIKKMVSIYFSSEAPNVLAVMSSAADVANLSAELGLEVKLFDPFTKCSIGEELQSRAEGLRLVGATSVGALACCVMKWDACLNLFPETFRKKTRRRILLTVAAVLACWIGWMAIAWRIGLEAYVEQSVVICMESEAAIGRLRAWEQRMLPLEAQLAVALQRRQQMERALHNRTIWVDLFKEIAAVLPEGMFVTSVAPYGSEGCIKGLRLSVVSYLDREKAGEDVVLILRDRLRRLPRFGLQSEVVCRPVACAFARSFELQLCLEEEVEF